MKILPNRLTENVKLLQKIALKADGKVLLLKRGANEHSRPLAWDLAGGNCDWPSEIKVNTENLHFGEAVREIYEETGIKVLESDFRDNAKLSFFMTFFEPENELYSIVLGWSYDLPSGFDQNSIKISHEHVEYKWVGLEEFEELDFGKEKRGDFIKKIILSSLE